MPVYVVDLHSSGRKRSTTAVGRYKLKLYIYKFTMIMIQIVDLYMLHEYLLLLLARKFGLLIRRVRARSRESR